MASTAAYALILFSLPFLVAGQPPAPAPAPALPDPVAILQKEAKYKTLLGLLTNFSLVEAVRTQVKDGITIFAPTDEAFKKLPNGTLEKLTAAQTTTILTYHVLPQYVRFKDLITLSNPVKTLATGYTLNFTGGNAGTNVSTGVVTTKVDSGPYDKSPLAIFSIKDVLIPVFPPAPPPNAGGPSAEPPKSSASFERVGWGPLVGAVLACLSFSLSL